MRNPFVHGVGGVLSADIAVPEHEQELRFYSSILTTGEGPLWREDLLNNLGVPVIGLGERTADLSTLPLQWMPHFQVADVATSASSATDMGGTVLMHGKDELGQSQWAVIVDPDGAAFGVIPVVASEADASPSRERFGCISWLSLWVSDASSSRDFYQRVVGWKSKEVETVDVANKKLEMEMEDGVAAAEICQFQSPPKGVPAVWLVHVRVGDLRESLRRVTEGGGEVVSEFDETDSAIIRDPVGIYFALQSGR